MYAHSYVQFLEALYSCLSLFSTCTYTIFILFLYVWQIHVQYFFQYLYTLHLKNILFHSAIYCFFAVGSFHIKSPIDTVTKNFIWDPVMAPCDPSSDPSSSYWRRSSVFIVNFEPISHFFLMFLSLNLNKLVIRVLIFEQNQPNSSSLKYFEWLFYLSLLYFFQFCIWIFIVWVNSNSIEWTEESHPRKHFPG